MRLRVHGTGWEAVVSEHGFLSPDRGPVRDPLNRQVWVHKTYSSVLRTSVGPTEKRVGLRQEVTLKLLWAGGRGLAGACERAGPLGTEREPGDARPAQLHMTSVI